MRANKLTMPQLSQLALLAAATFPLPLALSACSSGSDSGDAVAGTAAAGAAGAAGTVSGGSGGTIAAGAGGGSSGAAGAGTPLQYGPPMTLAEGLWRPSRTVSVDQFVVVSEAASENGGVYVYDLSAGSGKDLGLNAVVGVLLQRPSGEVWFSQSASQGGIGKRLNPSTLALEQIFTTSLHFVSDLADGGDRVALVGDQGKAEVRSATSYSLLFGASVPGAQTGIFFHDVLHVVEPSQGRIWRVEAPNGATKVWHQGMTMPLAVERDGDTLLIAEDAEEGRLLRLSGDASGAKEEIVATGLSFPLRVVAYGGDIYWAESGHCEANPPVADGKIVRRKADGTTVTLADGELCARGLSVSAKGVFWAIWEGTTYKGQLRGALPM